MLRQIEESKRELSRVMELLKEEPRGLSITDISRLLNMNRNSVSKYLNMLLISGHVDMRSIGVAKDITKGAANYGRIPMPPEKFAESVKDYGEKIALVL
ncbi:MAG: helix-turn-helix domain-containing protein, partial [Methanomicrobium sp.]|nr:helix-turn-helix domain-containing protein [Methanomicrobium sp.]